VSFVTVVGILIWQGKIGGIGLLAFALPPALLAVWLHQYTAKSRRAALAAERANDELRRSNADLRDLYEFSGGLAQTHESSHLAAYVEASLSRILDARVQVTVGPDGAGAPLESDGRVVGTVLVNGGDTARWERLRDAIEPQVATALECTALSEEVRKSHVETIAALSRSMETRESYTGDHTERVSGIAVGLARRLGYECTDLNAIEIGALMHDIGKIGIPESILHKPGPLDNDEWILMKRHPVISELILKEIDLSPIVTQIARSSHERMDGQGYPDGLVGEEIPLPARIVLVADAFDALASDRPHRPARPVSEALDELRANAGTQFCPKVLAALESLLREQPERLRGGELPEPAPSA
jgi:HD-GYP domain-containing protein (c-di-GMP phosphodiesterase class II)